MSTLSSRILGLGAYVPPRVVTNAELATLMETTNEWIIERTGIEERRWAAPGEGGAEMAAKAATQAMERAGITAKDVDMLIYATLSPDVNFPGTGVFTQRLLGLREVPCYDIRQQCTGFLYGLAMADAFIRTGQYKHILVIGAEVHSTGLDLTTNGRDVAVLFGDGAGCAVVGRGDDDHRILSTHLHADGKEAEILWVEFPASRNHPRITAEAMAEGKHYPRMVGKKVFKHAVTRMPAAIMEGMVTNQLKLDDIDMVIPHQANLRINQMVAQMIGLPPERMHNNIQKYGNTTAASIPICMNEAIELGKIKPGNLVCLVAFGAGLTWGSAFLRY
ncbi:MAG: ketoacyl-ACP synthase III [Kofleriaceae bacterium]|jgi:3-oxoacyl-[acyl-carrier-protein] synthase-3|nr:ketoacyl-ACP synthase III [Kofleriaceae bacterium]MBP6837195.1 ketoacyl-ACP synthase III [Kofleriaceae bacterium]MBP9203686.1 ketoacyl-ACP synthase III [Kofleriaceae bacterium]